MLVFLIVKNKKKNAYFGTV